MDCLKEKTPSILRRALKITILLLAAVAVGVLCGVIGAAFAKSISFVTEIRSNNSWLIYLLPVGGLVSALLYKICKLDGINTDKVLEGARGEDKIPIYLVPIIFISSVITHLFGGSAGKEGAALQIGSGVSEFVAKITKAEKSDEQILIICGMGALFSAVFGTPVGACVFALEVAVVGSTNIAAALPTFISSVTAFIISKALTVKPEKFHISEVPETDLTVLLKTVLIALAVAVVGYIFCHALHWGEKLFAKVFRNPFIGIFAGGLLIIVLTLIFGTDYNGGGMFVVERIFEEGTVRSEAFILKLIFTVVTVSAGFKGGEIVPSFFIGATLGATLSPLLGITPEFGAAIGMASFFSAVTNCPLASAILSIELFGADGFICFAAASFISYAVSGKVSIYHNQKFSKFNNIL